MKWSKYLLVVCCAILSVGISLIAVVIVCTNKTKTITVTPVEDEELLETMTTTEEETTTKEESTTEEETTTEVEPVESTMYVSTLVNFRAEPNTESEILKILNTNAEVIVLDYDRTNDWTKAIVNNTEGYIYTDYLSEEKIEIKQVTPANITGIDASVLTDEFHYYGIWSGPGWHFTPEQIDDAWHYIVNGEHKYRSGKPHMEAGSTRAWQKYLYETLSANELGWFYKIACAQAMQESGFNPLNNASTDHGLFSFRETYWNSHYGDIYDYHANINAYVDRIKKYLVGCDSDEDIYLALSQHYNPTGQIHSKYVNDVLSHLKELWICD